MKELYYVGLDIHKKTIAYCVKRADGRIVDEGTVRATRSSLTQWVSARRGRWIVGMEATLFTGWVYDFLKPCVSDVRVGHPYMLRAIVAGKKKNDRLDALTLADLLRCDLFPACYMAPPEVRELRRVLRYRNLLVSEATRMKNKTAGLLMEVGAEYTKSRLHGKRYFNELLHALEEVPSSVLRLLRLTHESMKIFERNQRWLLEELARNPELCSRLQRLMSIAGVGEVTALTWALEIGDPHRFRSVKQAVSYCGLCSRQDESAGVSKRGPLSKQRNKHLQRVLVEAAKLAPRWNPQLAAVYTRERDQGANHNRATLAVARKLVAYLLCVDKTKKTFEPKEAA
jgi:transposase